MPNMSQSKENTGKYYDIRCVHGKLPILTSGARIHLVKDHTWLCFLFVLLDYHDLSSVIESFDGVMFNMLIHR